MAVVPLLALARVVATSRRPARAGAGWGLLAGMVFFLPLLTWIGRFGLAPWVLLAFTQALTIAAFVAVLAAWGSRPWRPAVAVVAWVALEAVRTRVPLTGFPWGVLGYTQHDGGLFLPVARSVGVLGVSAALVAVAACLEEAAVRARRGLQAWQRSGDSSVGEAVFAAARTPIVALLVVLVACVVVAGSPPPDSGRVLDIAGVQGHDGEVPAALGRGDAERIEGIAERMLAATLPLGDDPQGPPDVVVWPENALDTDVRGNPRLEQILDQALGALDGAPIVAGELLSGPRPGTFRNAMVVYESDGTLADVYVKRVLVPFGEYVPFRSLLGDLPPLRQVPSDGIPGEGPVVFDVAGARIGPVTCFESIFGELVRDQVRAGAEVLVVSTNNASFGRTAASAQHLAFSQVRAVETGRWVLHAGISGLSGVVSPTGAVTQQTELFERAVVRAELPLVEGTTPFVVVGDVLGPAAMVLLALLLVGLAVARLLSRGDRTGRDGG